MTIAVAVAAAAARQAAPAREPASKAAAILTWPPAQREQYIAALDSFFLTRTVKAGPRPRALGRGRPLAAFEKRGQRADYFEQFMNAERVRGVLVLQDGQVRLERYAPPHSAATRWNSFSIAKSITSTLVGAAIKDGYIQSLDHPVTRYIKALHGSAYDDVTVRQLLTMTSGVKWNEDYTDVNSDVARMYAQAPDPGFDMTVSYVRKLPREAAPGTKWVYKTSETNLVGVLVAEATGKHLADYLSEKIWRPYGMARDAEWMIDDVGHEQGGCCLAMTLGDYGRFGQFILDGARVDGQPIVPENWIAEATRTQVSTGAGTGYGYQWWTRDDGTFEGRGIYGQTLHIDRARRLVIVINSATEQPTGRPSGQARQAFIAAVAAELDGEKQIGRGHWDVLEVVGQHIPRFESGYIKAGERFYLVGGRQAPQPVEVFDVATRTWKAGAVSPVTMHHFQPVVYDGKIYVLGALTGSGRGEPPLPDVYIYDPATDRWDKGPAVPADRLRGGAGAVVHDGLIYLVAGHQLGHSSGHVAWLDSFNPRTGEWRRLADAPRPRDHFQAVVLGGKMYAVGGRRSAAASGHALDLTIPEVDVFDFASGRWSTLPDTANLPTQRAGVSTVVLNGLIVVIGGESAADFRMHTEVEALNPATMQWTTLAPLNHGRHGTGAILHDGKIYVAAGSTRQGTGDRVQEVFTPGQ